MPEAGEVAHAVANLKRNILGYTIKSANFLLDDKIFSGLKEAIPDLAAASKKKKVSPYFYAPELKFSSPTELENRLIGEKITSVGRHGKYFWVRTARDSKHANEGQGTSNQGLVILMHFGMTGWLKFKGIYSHFIQMESGGYKKVFKLIGIDENGNKTVKEEDKDKDKENRNGNEYRKKEENKEEEVEESKVVNRDTTNADEWPPRFHKFLLSVTNDNGHTIDVGFVDPRRLAKVRLYDVTEKLQTDELLLKHVEQLSKLGPDYSKSSSQFFDKIANLKTDDSGEFVRGDPDPYDHQRSILNLEEFKELFRSKPNLTIKPFLLKQEYFAGVGNWMADEILFHSRIYPEELLGSLDDSDLERLYEKIIEVSKIAVEVEAEATRFPQNWLMLFRWGKKAKKTFEGHDVDFVTVGGRTSCFVPAIQKKKGKKGKALSKATDNATKKKLTPRKRKIEPKEKEEHLNGDVDVEEENDKKKKKVSKKEKEDNQDDVTRRRIVTRSSSKKLQNA